MKWKGGKKKTGFLQRRNGSVRLPGGHSDHRPALFSRRKSGCLLQRGTKTAACIHKQEINGQISCVLSTLYRILIQKQPFHYRRNRHRFFTTGGQSYWFCKRKVNVWCRFPVCVVDCMQTRGSICFLLIGVWRSSAHQDSHFYRLARAHTHAHTRTHTVIKQNRAMCLQLPGGRRCSDSLQANCDLVESCDWCSGAKLEKANWATNTTDPVGTL